MGVTIKDRDVEVDEGTPPIVISDYDDEVDDAGATGDDDNDE